MVTTVLDVPGVSVVDVCCATTVASGAREIQGFDGFEVLFVRSGCFTFRDSRGEVLVDPITCVLGSPRQLAEIVHPLPGGDVYTQIKVTGAVWHDLTFDGLVPLAARVSGAMQVAVRALTAAGRRRDDSMAIEESALNLVAAAVADAEPRRMVAGRAGSDLQRQQPRHRPHRRESPLTAAESVSGQPARRRHPAAHHESARVRFAGAERVHADRGAPPPP